MIFNIIQKQVNPPRSEKDFYNHYDPMVGIGTAIVLCIFFLTVTIKSCMRYTVRKWRMYHFYKNMEKEQNESPASIEVTW